MSTINTVYEILKIAHDAQDAVLIEGLHGIGKSNIAQSYADDHGRHLFPLFLSTQETGDLIGIPDDMVLEDGSKVTTWSKPTWLHEMEVKAAQGIHSILFLDELNRAPLDVRQCALQLVLEGRIHEHQLPVVNGIKTQIIAAINPSDDYQVQELDPALLDRFLHLHLEVSATEWLEWAREAEVLSVIRDFVSEFPDRLHYTPREGKGPTPRAWAKLSELLTYSKDAPKNVLFDIIRGRLGSEVGSQFFSYFSNYTDVVKADDVEDFIVKNDCDDIEELGERVKKEFGKIEAIRKHEIATELANRHLGSKEGTDKIALAYLYSLEVEIQVSFIKKLRGDDNKDLFQHLVNIDHELNNKELFRRNVNLASRSN